MVLQSLQTFLENEVASGWDVALHFQKTKLAILQHSEEIYIVLEKRKRSLVSFASIITINCTVACMQNTCDQVSKQLQQRIASWVEQSKHQPDERVVGCEVVEQTYTKKSIGIHHYSSLIKLKLQVITPKK